MSHINRNHLSIIIIIVISVFIRCGKKEEVPVVATIPVADITATTATSGGEIEYEGTSTIISNGVCWSTKTTPTIADNKTVDGTGSGSFLSNLSPLDGATNYYVRAYASNSTGTGYGTQMTFVTVGQQPLPTGLTDVEGNTYNTIAIGSQVWMKENLKTTKYRNGDLIGTTAQSAMDITAETAPKYQWANTINDYGRLYTYYAVTDSRNVCPTGWHIPSDGEWTTLTDYLSNNDYGYDGNKNYIAKSLAATSGWTQDPVAGNVGNDQGSNNSSGFTGLPGGGRYSTGIMNFVTYHSIWWSSTESSSAHAFFRCVGYIPAAVFRGEFSESYGLGVRCLKDN